jgi:chitin disaccharide deacetylase
VLFNEHMIYPWPRRTRDVLFEEIPKPPPRVSEIFAHPVLDGEELRAYDTRNSDIRVHDAACLTDPTVSDLLDRHNIKRISFRELRGTPARRVIQIYPKAGVQGRAARTSPRGTGFRLSPE